ncbi:F-box/kelch-repeat protein At3g23880-like [Neltuma alba]|uniref:F-box/kelch-repeat protein At3g23880-like n=1 Tax=Neltuma alba TaxID=207710 RepID=UPI0010A3B211|nr:F-box/kelch-repeat protein At3g23880-like [Prosopis alba]
MSDYLPPEVWVDILRRLPLKSIGTCMSVCKSWKSFIADPYFLSQRSTLQVNQTNGSLLIGLYPLIIENYSGEMKHYFVQDCYLVRSDSHQGTKYHSYHQKLLLSDTYYDLRLIGVCNGLVCFVQPPYHKNTSMLIWNPSLRRYIDFPTSAPSIVTYPGPRPLSLFGFGYDSKNNDFKVVRVFCLWVKEEAIPQVEVYSLASASWKKVSSKVPPFLVVEKTSQTMFLNDAIHWLVRIRKGNDVYYTILSFDVVKETLSELMLGHCLKETLADINILPGLVDLLAISTFYLGTSHQTFFSVWVMKKYGVVESWTEMFRFPSCDYGNISTVLALKSNDQIMLRRVKGDIILLDLKNNLVEDNGTIRAPGGAFVECYVENLFLMNHQTLPRQGADSKTKKTENHVESLRKLHSCWTKTYTIGRAI